MSHTPLLDIQGLSVSFATRGGAFQAVDGVDLRVAPNEVLAIVGESGSGKSVAMLAIMGLLPWTATVTAQRMVFDGQDLLAMSPKQRRNLIGKDVAMVFQEPMSSLNPCFTVGWQIAEALAAHTPLSRAERKARVVELLDLVGIPDAARRASAFPHQLSGGMRQRVMIAMALACKPRLLIADEPTTALDVTVQAQILDLLQDLSRKARSALILITHDLGVVARYADRVIVMYGGRVVETAPASDLYARPSHPYTRGLMASIPRLDGDTGRRLVPIEGQPPDLSALPPGCAFAPRCRQVQDRCRAERPALREFAPKHFKACFVDD